MEKALWEFTAFPELESLKAFQETEIHVLVSDKQKKKLCLLQLCLYHVLIQAGRRRNYVSKNPPPPPKKESQKSLDTASLMFPMGLDKDYPSKGIVVCMQLGVFQKKREAHKM